MEPERARFSLLPCRRPWSTVFEARRDDSSNRSARTRFSRSTSPPPARRRFIIFDDDSDGDDDDRHRPEDENENDDAGGEEVDEDYVGVGVVRRGETSEIDREFNLEWERVYRGGEDEEPQPQPQDEEEDSDDERAVRLGRRGGGGGGGGADQPAAEDDDSDDDRPILSRLRSRTVVRPGPTAPAPAPAPAMAPPAAPPELPVIEDATVAKINGADCGICYLPLKPPIFQCAVGHVVCSWCSARMGNATSCHKCRAPMPGGYTRRCHDMEQLVDSIRVPCPHAAHGCAARPVYHARDAHARACPHAPCRCPAEACGFAGPTAALADHLAAGAHRWPCFTEPSAARQGDKGGLFSVALRDGFNFITGPAAGAAAAAASSSDDQGAAAAASNKFLFLLNVERAPPFGRAITALCVHHDRAAAAKLKIVSSRRCGGNTHQQTSELEVACTDFSNGLPDPTRDCFRFVVPGSGREEEDATTRVIVRITQPPI
ncbi:unnamed protein product [Urochloa humidicola]